MTVEKWKEGKKKMSQPVSLPSSSPPTVPFTFLEPQDQEISQIHLVQERRATDFVALKL